MGKRVRVPSSLPRPVGDGVTRSYMDASKRQAIGCGFSWWMRCGCTSEMLVCKGHGGCAEPGCFEPPLGDGPRCYEHTEDGA